MVGVTTELAGYTLVYPMKSHTAADLKTVVSWCISDLAQKGFYLLVLRTDNGPEMLSADFQTFLSERRIGWEQSMPYIHTSFQQVTYLSHVRLPQKCHALMR